MAQTEREVPVLPGQMKTVMDGVLPKLDDLQMAYVIDEAAGPYPEEESENRAGHWPDADSEWSPR